MFDELYSQNWKTGKLSLGEFLVEKRCVSKQSKMSRHLMHMVNSRDSNCESVTSKILTTLTTVPLPLIRKLRTSGHTVRLYHLIVDMFH